MGFFAIDAHRNNLTRCATTGGIFPNLTSSYSAQINETSAFSVSVVMFFLAALFFILNLFSGLSDVSAIVNPKVRVFLSSVLSLFLPVMSYLFSEAKNMNSSSAELPLRARLIITWMLLVELLRKKVEEIRYVQGSAAGTFERVGRVVWLGNLVFSNLVGAGGKTLVGILWLLCLTKLCQRIAYTEVGKRSFAFGKNSWLVTSYMAQVLERDQHQHHHLQEDEDDGDKLLKACKYVVMEEENLVVEAIPGGYMLIGDGNDDGAAACTTVGKIWELAETDPLISSLDRDQRLSRLCLSMALFKLLRRRFEHQPAATMTALETRSYRELIVKGLYTTRGGDDVVEGRSRRSKAAEALFQVTSDELKFLSEYYHSVVPVVLASPFFLLANYFLLPLMVLVLCLVLITLCGNGDLSYVLGRIKADNTFITFFNVSAMLRCLGEVLKSPLVFLCVIDMSITTLLFLMSLYEQAWEFLVFLLSDWFMVSLLCKYCTSRPRWHHSRTFSFAIRFLSWARGVLTHPAMSFHQLCVLRCCWLTMPPLPPILVPAVTVPAQVKHAIMEYLTRSMHDLHSDTVDVVALSNGRLALAAAADHADLMPFCDSDSDSVAEVILTWHIATSLLEVSYPPPAGWRSSTAAMVATSLSRYCAYLVAFHPELLSDHPESTERVLEETKGELRRLLGFWRYYCFPSPTQHHHLGGGRYNEIMTAAVASPETKTKTAVHKGAALAHALEDKARRSIDARAELWGVLSDFWVELIVYIAPSSQSSHEGGGVAAGHANELAKGGEFITVLWALATHAGVSRPANVPPAAVPIQRVNRRKTPHAACV